MKKLSPRAEFIENADSVRLAAWVWDAMQLASTHDPDHAKELEELRSRVEILERQMERIGAPLYRVKGNLAIQKVRNLPKPDYKLRSTDEPTEGL